MGFVARFLSITIFGIGSAIAFAAGPETTPEPHRTLLARVQPAYPELARRMHISGNVVLIVEIRPNGTVGETRAESGHALLRQAAEDAVRQWRFAPGAPGTISVAVSFDAHPE